MDSELIKKYLHHRDPYLMISAIESIDSNSIIISKIHQGTEGHIQGHFPGAPVVPGAMLQEICTQAAGIIIAKYYSPVPNYDSDKTKGYALGVLKSVRYAKYKGIVKPDRIIKAEVKLVDNLGEIFQFKANVYQDAKNKASLMFTLVNISDSHLY